MVALEEDEEEEESPKLFIFIQSLSLQNKIIHGLGVGFASCCQYKETEDAGLLDICLQRILMQLTKP